MCETIILPLINSIFTYNRFTYKVNDENIMKAWRSWIRAYTTSKVSRRDLPDGRFRLMAACQLGALTSIYPIVSFGQLTSKWSWLECSNRNSRKCQQIIWDIARLKAQFAAVESDISLSLIIPILSLRKIYHNTRSIKYGAVLSLSLFLLKKYKVHFKNLIIALRVRNFAFVFVVYFWKMYWLHICDNYALHMTLLITIAIA